MTDINSTNNSDFSFASKEAAIALLIDARKGHEAMTEELQQHEAYMSDLCKAMLETFGSQDEESGKKYLQLDLGDGSPRGHIVVQRGDHYFVRERNSGRPAGSKNKKTRSIPPAQEASTEVPEVVVEEPSVVTASSESDVTEEQAEPIVTSDEIVSDPVADAILNVATQAINALREHRRASPVAAASAAE